SKIQLIQESWKLVMLQSDSAGTVFYTRLFLLRPDLRELFGNDIKSQRRRLILMIDSAVKSVEYMDEMEQQFRSLGIRHECYGVRSEDYPYMYEALLAMLRSVVADDWSEMHEQAWKWMF